MLVVLILVLFTPLIIYSFLKHYSSRGRNPNRPPGNFGWPFFGESSEFIRSNLDGSPERFILDRLSKHKTTSVFTTSLWGEKMAVLCGPAGNKFLFLNEGKKVALWWPASVTRLLGPSLITKAGEEGRVEKKVFAGFFSPDGLMRCIATMDNVTREHFRSRWAGKEKLETYSTMKLYTFELACRLFMGITDHQIISELAVHFNIFIKGVISLPINFPGTRFYRARKAADAIKKELCVLMNRRRKELEEKTVSPSQDLLSYLLTNADENGRFMPEIEILNNMLNLLFAGHDTSSSALTLVIKYLAELPDVRKKVLAEQKEIAASKGSEETLCWDNIQNMRYSWNVISEVMRLNPPVAGSFREALVDIKYEGYTIPKGWKLFWSAAVTHKDPKLHQVPSDFDESRFEGSGPQPFSYVPFGGGPRMCLGKEFARLEMLVFLHNLVNNFEWDLVNPVQRIMYDPMPAPIDGLPIRVRPLVKD